MKILKNYQNFGKLAVGNNEDKNVSYQNQFYFYFEIG